MSHRKFKAAALFLSLAVSCICLAKGQTLKLDGNFTDVRVDSGIVTFTFSGKLLDSSHPDSRTGFPIWDYPINVENLEVTSRDAVCMDHRNKRNFSFKDQPSDALECYRRIEELVAAVPISGVKFKGAEIKSLDAENLHFYGMEQVR